jgi:tetratricopeptide (TPR) repeat protein
LSQVKDPEFLGFAREIQQDIFVKQEKWGEAFKGSLAALKEASKEEQAQWASKAVVYFKRGKLTDRVSELEKAIQAVPLEGENATEARLAIGRAYFEKKNCKKVKSILEIPTRDNDKATEKSDAKGTETTSWETEYILAQCEAVTGAKNEAVKRLERVVASSDKYWSSLAKGELRKMSAKK